MRFHVVSCVSWKAIAIPIFRRHHYLFWCLNKHMRKRCSLRSWPCIQKLEHSMWCDVMWCDVMWCDAMRCDVMWCDAMRCDATWCDVMWCDAMRCDALCCDVMWCDVMWCDAMRCDAMRCVVLWCDVMWCDVMWCDVMWCDVMWCKKQSACLQLSRSWRTHPSPYHAEAEWSTLRRVHWGADAVSWISRCSLKSASTK